jgi:potassium-transporting ATPase KdpC subunit
VKKHIQTALLMTFCTTLLLGVVYPLVVTAGARLLFSDKAQGELIHRNGKLIGSRIIGQPFYGPGYFHSRPSAAGSVGYDAAASQGSNLGPTNRKLVERITAEVKQLQAENPGNRIPADLVTTSASGLDPDISPASALFQIPRVARERGVSEDQIRSLVLAHTQPRQFGLLGEPRVNVLELNLALDDIAKTP